MKRALTLIALAVTLLLPSLSWAGSTENAPAFFP